jgi:hypothetical protein
MQILWVEPVGPTDIEFFSSSSLGERYINNIFVGDITRGNLYLFEVDENRDRISIDTNQQQSGLSDLIVDNEDELSAITFGSGFGGITDIETDQMVLYIFYHTMMALYTRFRRVALAGTNSIIHIINWSLHVYPKSSFSLRKWFV